jgi:hypothetical protein
MAVIYTATIGGYTYGFDFADKRIDIDASLTVVIVGNLWDAIQEAQASVAGMAYDQAATAEGLTTLSAGVTTFLTVSFLSTWEINTLLSSGKFEVQGGNLVRDDGSDPFRDNPLITYINNLSQAGVVATAETGVSGLTSDESTKLDTIATVDSNVGLVKAKTDQMTFTKANELDSNIQSVNDVTVTGTGASGDEWGP